MKTLTLLCVVALSMSVASHARAAEGTKKMLYHVVSLKFKPTATPEQVKAVEQAFADLKTKIPGIVTLNWGTNVSPEKHDKGFTHMWVLSFKSPADRDAYLVERSTVVAHVPHVACLADGCGTRRRAAP